MVGDAGSNPVGADALSPRCCQVDTPIIQFFNKGAEMPTLKDPTLNDLSTISSEEFYEEMYDFGGSYDPMPIDMDEECPEWIQEQLDEDTPF